MTLFFAIKSYIKFLWDSKNQHGVHSPFVFDLVTKCFYDKTSKPEYGTLKKYRNELLQNKSSIEVIDFGAGSRVFKSNKRPISKIAQTAGISPKRAELLFRIVHYFQPNSILEIGTSLGLATSALSLGNPKAAITTLEGCSETAKIAETQFEKFQLQNIHLEVTEFSTYLKNVKLPTDNVQLTTYNQKPTTYNLQPTTYNIQPTTYNPQLIYFDGNHSRQATLLYFELLLPTITNDTVWIFDDIHWSTAMTEAWETIKKHPKVKVTIDTFQWGLVFFRNEQEKEHFTIRV
jgi:predicted O-methyltransferase YrrM